jgi:hypothetical protein
MTIDRDSLGNAIVAYEFGNMPMQPNLDRTDDYVSRPGELNNYSWQYIPPVLGAGDSHAISGTRWDAYPYSPNANGQWNDNQFVWPSVGVCYNSPKSGDGRWPDLIEYLRTCGVNPAFLKEATFTGGANKYDWQGGSYDSGIIFWSYIPASYITYIDWQTGTVFTGKDLDGMVVGSYQSWGNEVNIDCSPSDIWFTAFTNDPAKNNTAGWL